MTDKPKDFPREELMQRAEEAILATGGPENSYVLFKYTCPNCGERCILRDKNMLYENGECHKCGTESPITEGGFALMMIV